jgi:2,3-dihydroxybiphenyl 1,2-dioxygenase
MEPAVSIEALGIEALGYVGVRAKSLEDWTGFGKNFLGMQIVDKSTKSLALRMDDRKQRLFVAEDGGEGVAYFGWEVADAAALDQFAARLEQAGVQIARGSRALADERRVQDLIVLADPVGNRLEVFHGAETTTEPFRPGRNISGFRTGPLGMGHAVLHVKNINDVVPFYRDVLGFRLSDYLTRPFNAYFFHANPRHHSIAFIETGRNATHHLMVELFSLDDVGQCYDLALAEEGRIGVTLGRHINDEVTSFYSNSPSGFMVEYGWGGRTIEPQGWQPQEITFGPSLWGHDRMWQTPEGRAEARNLRVTAATTGLRRPVNVIEGNYQLVPGVCPWWDGVARGEAAE